MQMGGRLFVALLLAAKLASVAAIAAAEPETKPINDSATLTVIDEAGVSHTLSTADIARLPQRKLKAKSEHGENEFEGVSLVDVLQSLGVGFGKELRGKRAATVALCEAADGYRVVITLLDIDPATTDKVVLLADRRDGQALGDKEGPFRLVIPDDKHPIRWIRMLRAIRVMNLKDMPLDYQPGAKAAPQSNQP
jgi:hypothetical protein